MMIKKILKILGYIFVPLLPMAVGVYFLFPYLNEEKHDEVTEKYDDEVIATDTVDGDRFSDIEITNEDFATSKERTDKLQKTIQELHNRLDSLSTVNDSLANTLSEKNKELSEYRSENDNAVSSSAQTENEEISEEELAEKVKSLLDLDNESLSPIINKMSDQQLVRLYEVGSSLQRKKLLRAMESERAAKLMTELM